MTRTTEELVSYQEKDAVVHFTDYLLEKSSAPSGQVFGCDFKSFDTHMKGLKTGEVIVVTGKKKNGKTLFAESWIKSMMWKDRATAKVAVFSFEMPPEDLLVKYMSDEWLPIYLPMQLRTMDFDWLYERCVEAKLKYNSRIVFIDHLHFMVDMSTKQNMSLNIGAFMRRLKSDIAIGLNMAVVLIAHQQSLKKEDEASSDTMRDSSFIGQEADAVIVVSRKKNYTEEELCEIQNEDEEKYFNIRTRNAIKQPLADGENDAYSAGFAKVTIDCNRRTGVFGWSKIFQKNGEFLEEI